jgi:diacylglycerol kinase family enzyme
MEIAVLHNPTAGDRDLPHRELAALLRRAGYRPHLFSLKEAAWRKKRAFGNAKFVVVAGGDGSVRKAVLQLHDYGLPFALLPLGTANNICTSLGIVGEPRQIIASWSRARPRKIDLGLAKGPWGEKLFIESVGVGLIGRAISIMTEIGAAAGHRPEWRADRLHRDATVVQALAYEVQPVRLTAFLDKRRLPSDKYLLFEAMNISHVGPGLKLSSLADPTDGTFEVVFAKSTERERLKRSLTGSLGRSRTGTTLTRRKARSLRIELHDGEFRLDDTVLLPRRRSSARGRSLKTAVTIDLSIRYQAYEILI